MHALRYILGYCIAIWYIIIGKRRRLLKYYDKPGTCLAIVGHNPNRRDLELLLKWYLQQGFTFILPYINEAGIVAKGRIAWLSFDDGWQSFKTDVLPVLEKLNIPATLFIAPHETEQGQLWTNGIRPFVGDTKIKQMYSMPWRERQKIVEDVFSKCSNKRRLLTREDVVFLAKHPLVDIQNHTMTHLSCSRRPVHEVLDDVMAAQSTLRAWIGKDCRLVCYPFCHHTIETDDAIKSANLIPVCGDAGEGTFACLGATRNMFKDKASLQENIGSSLNAWRKVKVPK